MRKHIWFLLVSCLIAVILGFLILDGSKTAVGIIILIFLVLILGGSIFRIGVEKINRYILYIIVFSIPFPFLLQFLGRDALTVTTIMIYFLFIFTILCHFFKREGLTLEPKFAFILPTLVFASLTVSLILNPCFIGQSIKYYIANVSGILLYFIVLATIKKDSDVTMVIKIILFTLVLESGIVFLEYKFPAMTKYLEFFDPTIKGVPLTEFRSVEGFIRNPEIHRYVGTIWSYELLAEWFLLGSILSVGLFYKFKKNIYTFCLFCCLVGIVFTVTRAAFFLLIFGLILVVILLNTMKKDSKRATIKIILLLFLSYIILGLFFTEYMEGFIRRLEAFFQQPRLFSIEAINRQDVWEKALHFFLKKPTIFGKGLYNVEMLYSTVGSFHSLYLTMLYKIGILGLAVHLVFWLKMLHASWYILAAKKKCGNWHVLFFLFISVILILIDGIKVEYLRHGHTIQFAWLIYGLLNVSIKQSREDNENIMVSPASI